MSGKYLLGAIPSAPDARDYSVKMRPALALPETFSQHAQTFDKQRAGNCVAQSLRSVLYEIFGVDFGVDMTYGGARPRGQTTPGLRPNEAANFVAEYGVAPRHIDPDEREVTDVIEYYTTARALLESHASLYKGCTWARATSAAEIKAALYSGMYVIACFAISQWDTDRNGIFPCTAAIHGYHEMRIVGWDRLGGKEYAMIANSWGKGWGKDGTGYVSWEDVLRCGDMIIIQPPAGVRDVDDEVEIRRTLRKGMKGEDVRELQTTLNALGCFCGAVDGDFGSRTRTAVKSFQRRHLLVADGIVGKKTWEALENEID